MIVVMGLTTFITQRQIMGRTGATLDPQQAQVQKILLYVMPFSFAVFGFSFPVGVLLYWLTTNVWSMGQQRISRVSVAGLGLGVLGVALGCDRHQVWCEDIDAEGYSGVAHDLPQRLLAERRAAALR